LIIKAANFERGEMIRTATTNDIELIRAIAHEVWPVSYRDMISPEQIAYMLDMMYSKESLLRQMNDEACCFLIAQGAAEAKGFASFSEVSDHRFKLHKLYVLSTEQGKGTGTMLLNEVVRRVQLKGGVSIELQVNKHNKAFHFYSAHGFVVDHELVLDIGEGYAMDDYVMVKKL
jgi:ribosomal protein S18 acetylase RimI-like enzyme